MSKPTALQIIKSVLSAVIGVQSEKNRLRDFQEGSLTAYIIAGVIFVVLFVATLILIVSLIL